MIFGFLSFKSRETSSKDIIKTRGLIIVDSLGRERILIGAPIPYTQNRVRTNLSKVKKHWGDVGFKGTNYMNWYKEFNNTANGIAIVDDNGFDRIIMGDPVPDPNIGKRIGPSTGIVINNDKGFERTGYGILKVPGGDRVVLGLDGTQGSEAASLSVYENGEAGLSFYGTDRESIFLGNSPANSQLKGKLNGLILRKDTIPGYILNSYK
ncbi:MAG: hypothetical protein IPM51_08595 [Sphingobacteriaceae bacterium]|nr:hypothetical protein [Sphingobacteriaceae bacterium]